MNVPCVLEKNETFSVEPSTGVKQVKLVRTFISAMLLLSVYLFMNYGERSIEMSEYNVDLSVFHYSSISFTPYIFKFPY